MKEKAFEKVKVFTIKVEGLKGQLQAKNLQYFLLGDDEVLRAHVNFENGKAKVAVVEELNSERLLEKFPAELKSRVESEKTIPFAELLKEAYYF